VVDQLHKEKTRATLSLSWTHYYWQRFNGNHKNYGSHILCYKSHFKRQL